MVQLNVGLHQGQHRLLVGDVERRSSDLAPVRDCKTHESAPGSEFNAGEVSVADRTTITKKKKRKKETDIVLSSKSEECRLMIYFARTMPAGHNCPPQPSLRSSFKSSGSGRRPSR